MNSAYEVEYNVLKILVEEINQNLDRLIGEVAICIRNRKVENSRWISTTLKEIQDKSYELESDALRFMVEYRPRNSDLRSVFVFTRIGSRLAEIASIMASLVNDNHGSIDSGETFSGSANTLRDILKNLCHGIREEDFDPYSIRQKINQAYSQLNKWFNECAVKIREADTPTSYIIDDARIMTTLQQVVKMVEALAVDLMYLVTGSHELSAGQRVVVALE